MGFLKRVKAAAMSVAGRVKQVFSPTTPSSESKFKAPSKGNTLPRTQVTATRKSDVTGTAAGVIAAVDRAGGRTGAVDKSGKEFVSKTPISGGSGRTLSKRRENNRNRQKLLEEEKFGKSGVGQTFSNIKDLGAEAISAADRFAGIPQVDPETGLMNLNETQFASSGIAGGGGNLVKAGSTYGKAAVKAGQKLISKYTKNLPAAGKVIKGGNTVKSRSITERLLTKQVEQVKTVTITNPLTGKQTVQEISQLVDTPRSGLGVAKWAVAATIASTVWLVDKILGGQNFGEFQKVEGVDSANMALQMAIRSGTFEDYLVADSIVRETLDVDISAIPYEGIEKGISANANAKLKALDLTKKMMQDREIAESNGEDEASMWTRINAGKAAEEKASVDYYNNQRVLTEQKLAALEIRTQQTTTNIFNQGKRSANAAERKEILAHQKNLNSLAEEERVAQAKFWLEYRQMMDAYELAQQRSNWDDWGNSNLGFGLVG